MRGGPASGPGPPRPGPARAPTVFSLSTRLSAFRGESCSCCGSGIVASGRRTESMAAATSESPQVRLLQRAGRPGERALGSRKL